MKARLVKTAFWSDDRVDELSPTGKYLFLYYLTNSYVGLTGAYKINAKRVSYETGLDEQKITEANRELESLKLIAFPEGNWVVLVNHNKHNNYGQGKLTGKAFQDEIDSLPENVLSLLEGGMKGVSKDYEGSKKGDINKKQEIINNKSEIRNKKQEIEGIEENKGIDSPAYIKAKQTAAGFKSGGLA